MMGDLKRKINFYHSDLPHVGLNSNLNDSKFYIYVYKEYSKIRRFFLNKRYVQKHGIKTLLSGCIEKLKKKKKQLKRIIRKKIKVK
jgi:hypothetical protein